MSVKAKYELEGETVTFTLPFGNYHQFLDKTRTVDGDCYFQENEEQKVSFPFQGVRAISQILKSMDCEVDTSELKTKIGAPVYEDLGQKYLRPEQYEFLKLAMKFWSGVLSLPTAYGKNVMIVYLCECSKIRNKKRIFKESRASLSDW